EGRQVILQDPLGYEKMSEILVEFAQPLLATAESRESIRKTIALAALTWNLSLLPERQQQQAFDSGPLAEIPSEMKPMLLNLIERKKALFPDIHRLIRDFEVTGNGPDLSVNVVSTLE